MASSCKKIDLSYKTWAGFPLCLTELPDNETLAGKGPIAAKDRKIMKAWVVTELGDPDQMIWTEMEEPKPGPDQVAIEVAASGLNFLDALMIAGRYQVKPPPPFVPGVEVSGTVIVVGENSGFSVGERVCATPQVGGFAQVAVADRLETERIPAEMSFIEAVAARVAYPTAYAALRLRADVKPGETVLVHAGAGGTGIAAIQIAKSFGCRVIATAGSERKLRICTEQGADAAFDYSTTGWLEAVKREAGKRGVDVVIDPVGGSITEESVRCLAWNGRLVVVGFAGGAIASIATNRLLLRNASVAGVYWGAYAKNDPDRLQSVFDAVFGMWRKGTTKPVVSAVLTIQDAPTAIKMISARQTHGKVVLVQ
jgi:NADPH2:quinone reductase